MVVVVVVVVVVGKTHVVRLLHRLGQSDREFTGFLTRFAAFVTVSQT